MFEFFFLKIKIINFYNNFKVLSFTLPEWRPSFTILQPTYNHQHLLIAGNESNIGLIYMYHITSQLLIRTFKGMLTILNKIIFSFIK